MPDTIFNPESVKDAIKLAEETLGRKVSHVDGSGHHRLVNWKGQDYRTRVVFSREPLNSYGGTLGVEQYRNEKGLSLSVEAFQENLKTEDIQEVVHVTGDADVYKSTPEEWRDFLNKGSLNPIWDVETTEERVISLPVSHLEQV